MQTSEHYRLYILNLLVEVMTEEINELMRYGSAPLGVGNVRPLDKERQNAIRPLLEKLNDTVREAAVTMIKEAVLPADEETTSEEWIKIMLEELRTRMASIGGAHEQELKNVPRLLDQIEETLG